MLATCDWLEDMGFLITRLPVDRTGMVDPQDLMNAITTKTCLASIMMANNEIGTIQPITECAAIAKERDVLFHTDAVQAAGRYRLMWIPSASTSCHCLLINYAAQKGRASCI